MELPARDLAPKYREILEICDPYLITHRGNFEALDLAPFGVSIPAPRRYFATSADTALVVDGLDRLDAFTFGGHDMKMPRWVLFDCGQFPGIVFGFGRRAADLPGELKSAYEVEDPDCADRFVPLSMWIAIRCAENGAWFAHNLSSANIMVPEHSLPGLGTLTKTLGVRLTRCDRQYGATQWDNRSLRIHSRLGQMTLCSAWTPSHSRPDTLVYSIDVDAKSLTASLLDRRVPGAANGDLEVDPRDHDALRALDERIEGGVSLRVVGVTCVDGGQRVSLSSR
jgi:hypothetical protein